MVKLDRSPEVKTFVLFLSDIEVRKFGEQSGLDILVVLTVNAEYFSFGFLIQFYSLRGKYSAWG